MLILLYSTLILVEVQADTRPLIVSFGPHNSPPFAITDNDLLVGGTIKDISDELSALLDVDIIFVQTPRKRIERYLEDGTIHLILTSNPKWLKNSEQYHWTEPLFLDHAILVVNAEYPKTITTFNDMDGMLVGTITGYAYPPLAKYLHKGIITRSDTRNLEANIGRLRLARIDSFISSKILFEYESNRSKITDMKMMPLIISENTIHGALSVHAPITITQLNDALTQLHQQGKIEAILKKYL